MDGRTGNEFVKGLQLLRAKKDSKLCSHYYPNPEITWHIKEERYIWISKNNYIA